ncbi:hypothetical protein C815_00668 [Firmicutes bacterium M10-2]|nr:hypothetical protein C815_00668 [Firmicutes bacterium M10-2]
MHSIVCFDIGGTTVKYALIQDGKILDKGSFVTTKQDGAQVLKNMSDIIQSYQSQGAVDGISISSPGFVDNKSGEILSGNIIDGFNGLNIRKVFMDQFELPTAIENDANCATIAEHYLGNGKGYENMVCMTLGTGVGGGVIINDRLYTGNAKMAGEFGFMFINGIHTDKPEDEILSGYASTRSLVEAVNAELEEEIDGKEIFERASQGDKLCQQKIDAFYDAIAMGIYNIAYVLNPDIVLIGGAVSMQENLLDEIKKRIEYLTPSFSLNLLDIMKIDRCMFLNDAGLMGAYSNFMETYH